MKRFLFLFAVMISFWAVAEAQTIVSTEPSNRNVVLEEYTGIHCVYCPDGHRIALGLKHDNPGRVFPINIHTGGYATPGAGEIDLRTADGDALAAPSGVTGYPAGSVNRSTTPWAQNRGSWANITNNILAQASPVNVGVKAMVDLSTRELVVNVEYFYTADEDNATNYLTVALTQSEIIGTQTGGANFNPDYVTADGLYRHQHALRDVLTESVWGDAITTTSKGTFGEKEYRVTLPESIKAIDVDMTQLEVIAFITQDKAEIITGAGTKVDIPAENKIMLSLEDQSDVPNDIFFTEFNPKVKVTNNFDTEVTQFDVNLVINGESQTKTVTETLAKGQSTIVDFGQMTATFTGVFDITIEGFGNLNNSKETGDLLVEWSSQDNSVSFSGVRLARKAFAAYTFDFENAMFPNGYFDTSENSGVRLWYSTSSPVGADNTQGSVLFYLHESWGFKGKPASIILGEANFSDMNAPALSYYYAYSDGTFGGNAPTIKVEVSENDGADWTEVYSVVATETNEGSDESLYFPPSSDFIQEMVSLADYAGKDVLVKLSLVPGSNGNAAWIDQIEFTEAGGTIFVANDELDFGKVTESDYAEKSITIENTASVDLTISSIVITDDVSGVFELVDVPSDLTIAGGESTDIKVEFMPLAIETYTAKLIINSNDANNHSLEVMLKGEGTGDGVAEEFVSNSSLQIMPNPVSTTATLKFNYTGAAAATVDYKLADVTGNTVADLGTATIMSGMNTLDFNVSELAAGKYFLVITSGNAVQQVPVVVEK